MSMELKVVFNLIFSLKNKNKYSKMMAKKKLGYLYRYEI